VQASGYALNAVLRESISWLANGSVAQIHEEVRVGGAIR